MGPRQSWQSPQGPRIDPAPPATGGHLGRVGRECRRQSWFSAPSFLPRPGVSAAGSHRTGESREEPSFGKRNPWGLALSSGPLSLSFSKRKRTWMAVDKISLPVFSLNTDRSCRTRSEVGWSRAFWASCTSDSRLPKGCSWSRTRLPMQET